MPCCPFCTGEYEMEESRQVLGAWFCPRCNTTFKLSKDELEPVYDFDPRTEMARRRTCQTPYYDDDGSGSPGVGGLCRSCQHNQTIIIQLLSSYDPPESAGAFDQLAAQYRRDLERRYPLCHSCKCYVDQRLSSLSLKLKTRKLAESKASGSARIAQLETMRKEIRQGPPSICFPVLNLGLDLAVLLRRAPPGQLTDCLRILVEHFPRAAHQIDRISRFPADRHIPSAIAAMGIFGAVQSIHTGLWQIFLYASLAALRFALYHTGIEDPNMDLACFVLVFLIDLKLLLGSKRPSRRDLQQRDDLSSQRETQVLRQDANVHPGKLPMNAIHTQPPSISAVQKRNRAPSPSKTITNDLMDIDWGLGSGSSRPNKGGIFSAPFSASLPTTERKPTFAPSKLDPNKAVSSMFNTPVRHESKLNFSLHPLKPAVLSVEQAPSGLDSAFRGFNFTEPAQPSKPFTLPKIQIPKFGFAGQIATTLFFLAFRIMARNHILLHGIVLAASFAAHGPVWTSLPVEWKYGCIGTAGLRFACLAAQLAEPDFADVMAGSLLLRLFCLFLDLAVIIIR